MFKSLKQFFGVYFGTLVFIIAMIIIASSTRNLLPDKDIAKIPVDVMMAILSAALAGAFTILGVEKTLREQNKSAFISQFPLKIFYLDQLIDSINKLSKSLESKNIPLLITDINYLQGLFPITTEIDGFIYFKVRQAHNKFSSIVSEIYGNEKLILKNEWEEWHIVEGKEEDVEIRINQLKKIVEDLKLIAEKYREDFINYYDISVDDSIYKKIKK